MIENVQTLRGAGPGELTFFRQSQILQSARRRVGRRLHSGWSQCHSLPLIRPSLVPFYPEALRSKAAVRPADASTLVHPTARIGNRVVLEPGAVVGREATIGDGTTIAAGAVIRFRVALGRDCYVGACATITPRRQMRQFRQEAPRRWPQERKPQRKVWRRGRRQESSGSRTWPSLAGGPVHRKCRR
jgi:NDP-sugar pyrophosphorylase family protein